uniref:Uncharacterized protein n=1 Tax=Ditylenchus dipsaci TaxID=166011 RepID=A0A915CT55_9BILA
MKNLQFINAQSCLIVHRHLESRLRASSFACFVSSSHCRGGALLKWLVMVVVSRPEAACHRYGLPVPVKQSRQHPRINCQVASPDFRSTLRLNLRFGYCGQQEAFIVSTARGNVSIEEVIDNVFIPNGYRLVSNKKIIPEIKSIHPLTCEQVFDSWQMMKPIKVEKAKTQNFSKYSYEDSLAVYYSTSYYGIRGKKGAVELEIEHPKISFLPVTHLVKHREIYYNSFDFIEVQKIFCMLKTKGIFYLGVPVGADNVGYNCHRTYGRLRLAFLLAGFDLLNVFYTEKEPINLTLDQLNKKYYNPHIFVHYVFVLRKP